MESLLHPRATTSLHAAAAKSLVNSRLKLGKRQQEVKDEMEEKPITALFNAETLLRIWRLVTSSSVPGNSLRKCATAEGFIVGSASTRLSGRNETWHVITNSHPSIHIVGDIIYTYSRSLRTMSSGRNGGAPTLGLEKFMGNNKEGEYIMWKDKFLTYIKEQDQIYERGLLEKDKSPNSVLMVDSLDVHPEEPIITVGEATTREEVKELRWRRQHWTRAKSAMLNLLNQSVTKMFLSGLPNLVSSMRPCDIWKLLEQYEPEFVSVPLASDNGSLLAASMYQYAGAAGSNCGDITMTEAGEGVEADRAAGVSEQANLLLQFSQQNERLKMNFLTERERIYKHPDCSSASQEGTCSQAAAAPRQLRRADPGAVGGAANAGKRPPRAPAGPAPPPAVPSAREQGRKRVSVVSVHCCVSDQALSSAESPVGLELSVP
ncbi:hypothetical protein ON010_g2382 [Phytophthora cinnamomi]|nr:hypothetical protein ON010_g2382 [Phytophthora cinnamomi]